MSAPSPIDSLRRLSPVSDADAGAVFGAAGREQLLTAVTSLRFGRRSRLRPTTRRGRLVLAVAVLAVAGVATAGTWAVLRAPARETTSVECMDSASNSEAIIPSISGDPAYDCAQSWQGAFGTAPPPLVAYDNGIGGVTVIPKSQKPWAGWTLLPEQSQDVALIELQQSLDDAINGLNSSCLDATAATTLAQGRLAQFGFTGWTVTVRDPDEADWPGYCVSAEAIDPVAKTVTLIPMNGLSAGGAASRLAGRLRPLTQSCETLPAAVAAVRAAGSSLGLSPAPPETHQSYELDAVTDNSLSCALIYENVGGANNVVVRGPSG